MSDVSNRFALRLTACLRYALRLGRQDEGRRSWRLQCAGVDKSGFGKPARDFFEGVGVSRVRVDQHVDGEKECIHGAGSVGVY